MNHGIKVDVLSVHLWGECNLSCEVCYMQKYTNSEKDFDFFLKLPYVARKMNIPQLAVGGGEPFMDPNKLVLFGKECKKHRIVFNITTNGKLVSEKNLNELRGLVKLISFSIDEFKQKSAMDFIDQFAKMDIARKKGFVVGCNLLLTDKILRNPLPLVSEILKHSHYIYLLFPKPNTISLDLNSVKNRILSLCLVSDRIFIDDCTSLLLGNKSNCERGRKVLSINPSGEACFCSFDKPFAKLENADELASIVEENYPQKKTTMCPFLGEKKCF